MTYRAVWTKRVKLPRCVSVTIFPAFMRKQSIERPAQQLCRITTAEVKEFQGRGRLRAKIFNEKFLEQLSAFYNRLCICQRTPRIDQLSIIGSNEENVIWLRFIDGRIEALKQFFFVWIPRRAGLGSPFAKILNDVKLE